MGFVPALRLVRLKVDRIKLVFGVTHFFVANIVALRAGRGGHVGHIGVFFYIWVGIFSLSIIAQFWSYANDIYTKDAGNRLFPIIAIGMTVGSPSAPGSPARCSSAPSPHVCCTSPPRSCWRRPGCLW